MGSGASGIGGAEHDGGRSEFEVRGAVRKGDVVARFEVEQAGGGRCTGLDRDIGERNEVDDQITDPSAHGQLVSFPSSGEESHCNAFR